MTTSSPDLISTSARVIGSEVKTTSRMFPLRYRFAEIWLEISLSPGYKTVNDGISYSFNARGDWMVPNGGSHL
jgi:hypothetical protein